MHCRALNHVNQRFSNLQSSETNFTVPGVNGCRIVNEGLVLIDSAAINGSDLEKEDMDAYSAFQYFIKLNTAINKKQLNKPKDALQPLMTEFYSQDEASKLSEVFQTVVHSKSWVSVTTVCPLLDVLYTSSVSLLQVFKQSTCLGLLGCDWWWRTYFMHSLVNVMKSIGCSLTLKKPVVINCLQSRANWDVRTWVL